MPRSRGSEMAQRVSTKGPSALRTKSSESEPLNRSPKLSERRSPRSVHSESLGQKKLGTRIAGMETQLDQAQAELKILKDQLAHAEAAKKQAQKELEKRIIKPLVSNDKSDEHESLDEIQKETDVFEVPVEMVNDSQPCEENESPEKPFVNDANEEISSLKAIIKDKEEELEVLGEENEGLKHQLSEANVEISNIKAKEEKMNLKLNQIEEEYKKSKNDENELKKKLKEVEEAKEGLEMEMKKLGVQTEQWRKAADAAAAILSGEVEMGDGRRVSERWGPMDKHYGGLYDGYGAFVGSPGMGDDGKPKGTGIKMFGDLWKKKGHK